MAKATRNACTPDVARDLTKIWYETDVRGVLSAVQVPTLILSHPDEWNDFDRANYVASLIQEPNSKRYRGEPGRRRSVSSIADSFAASSAWNARRRSSTPSCRP